MHIHTHSHPLSTHPQGSRAQPANLPTHLHLPTYPKPPPPPTTMSPPALTKEEEANTPAPAQHEGEEAAVKKQKVGR